MIIAVYDNTIRPNEIIQDVIGERGFGDVVVKRQSLKDTYRKALESMFEDDFTWLEFNSIYEIKKHLDKQNLHNSTDVHILHCFSDQIILDQAAAGLSFQKVHFVDGILSLVDANRTVAVMFGSEETYIEFLSRAVEEDSTKKALHTYEDANSLTTPIEGMGYIGEIGNFIQCITGNFDARYFNSLQGDNYTIRKSSTNKKKIKAEYEYYHMLPDRMKRWFVLPYDYQEDENSASYQMERLHMTDIAIKWVHGSINDEEFSNLMDMYFVFFNERESRKVTAEEYRKTADDLYVKKVQDRVEDLKQLPEYRAIDHIIDIDPIINRYLKLKDELEAKVTQDPVSVIGHGDPCFANAMYNRATRTLKFIDPKGALEEADLWTNPYYDIAKLSHSVCGRYDFFNNAMFEITVGEDFRYELHIPFDNTHYKEIFREKVEANGYDYNLVRLYEASLFLSMLPLHIDYPHKVLGFILNAVEILDEIEASL